MKKISICTFALFLLMAAIADSLFAQNFWQQTSGPNGGDIKSLAVNFREEVFAGTSGGGIFHSNDDGRTWTPVNNGLTNTFVNALAIKLNGQIFAGTNGSGVFRSAIYATNWTQINSGLTNTFINTLAINSSGHIFAGTRNGIFRSTDDGGTWAPVNMGLSTMFVLSIAVKFNGPIFVGTNGGGVFRSTNNGDNWTPANNGLTNTVVNAFAINAKGNIFAGTKNGVFRSINDGTNWTLVNVGLPNASVEAIVINSSGHIFAGTSNGGVFRSTDNGDNWDQVNTGLTNTGVYALTLSFDGVIFAGTLGGTVFRSVPTTPSPFTEISATLTDVDFSSVAWGDYDNDNDLDILLTGRAIQGYTAKIYRNDGKNFVDIAAALSAVWESAAAWGDYDNDGDLDILLTGHTGSSAIAKIYQNDNGNFSDINAALTGVYGSSAVWGDYDNDGDLDILIGSRVYRNDKGIFVDIFAPLLGTSVNAVAWGDYDNDGDLDILLTGGSGFSGGSKIYRNDNGRFVDIAATLANVIYGSMAWGDYDNDGNLDILLTGYVSDSEYVGKVYRNDSGKFVDISAPLTGVIASSVAWGDYDNDGDLDILLTGSTGPLSSGIERISKIYRNDEGNFVDIFASLAGASMSSVAWGDYDNDGDLDILLTGVNSKIYQNNINVANTAPTGPTGLVSFVSGNSVTLGWNKATDNQTAQNALTYNLRIGTTSGGVQKTSPMSNVATGYRKIPALGNTNHNNRWTIKNLPEGKYYWSAQAIDHAFAGSAFAVEQSFVINLTPAAPQNLLATAGDRQVTLTWNANNEADFLRYRIYAGTTANPTTKLDSVNGISNTTKRISGLTNGTTYYFRITAVDTTQQESLFSNEVSIIPRAIDVPPAEPQNLRATAGSRQVTLTWQANTEPDFLRYRIYGGTTSNPTTKLDSVNGIANTAKVITGLNNGITYYFRITAVDAALQESGYSNQVNAIPTLDDLPPTPPQNVRAVAGDRQVTITWNSNTETDFLRYRIYGGTTTNPTSKIDSVNGISNTTKIITGLNNGVMYYFRMTAVDAAFQESGYSNEASVTMPPLDTMPPNIMHTPLASSMLGQDIQIEATITDNVGVMNATLYYRRGGDAIFTSVSLAKTGNNYRGPIPATAVTTRGVEYYLAAKDSAGLTAQSVKVSVQVRVNGQGEIKGNAQPGGTEQIAYRLISVPLDLDNKSA